MNRDKLWLTGVIGAAVAGVVCLLPPILIALFGTTIIAFVPVWIDFVLIPVFLLFGTIACYAWYRRKS